MSELKTGGGQGYLRIATEEAFAPPELMDRFAEVLDGDDVDPGFESLMGFHMRHKSERATEIFRRLQDLDGERLADMDARGIDRQVIALTAPGTQILSKDKAKTPSVLAKTGWPKPASVTRTASPAWPPARRRTGPCGEGD
jgi:2,3-dihydroxybenzoate decarboxylase